jgi:isopenicillin N synthase-like dioxygenase
MTEQPVETEAAFPTRRMPLLDLAPLYAGDRAGIRHLADIVRETYQTLGFNSVVNHGLQPDLIERMTEQSIRFHSLPMVEKLRYRIDQNQRGYIPPKGALIKVSSYNRNTRFDTGGCLVLATEYDAGHPGARAGKRYYAANQWPEGLPGFRETVLEYMEATAQLGQHMLTLWALALDLPETFFRPFFATPYCYLRLSHYAPQPERADNEFGHSPHADASFQTFLPPAREPGLQILDTEGNWFWPEVEDGALILNAGLFLERWTNGRFRATPHRVIPPRANHRYSVAGFVNPDLASVCAPLPNCVGPDRPAKFPTESYWDFYNRYMSSIYKHYPEFETAAETL